MAVSFADNIMEQAKLDPLFSMHGGISLILQLGRGEVLKLVPTVTGLR